MTDFQAALAWSQFQRLENKLRNKDELADLYYTSIINPKLIVPYKPAGRNHTWQTFHLLLDDSLDQEKTIEKLKAQQIGTNYGAQCIPSQTYYKKKYNLDAEKIFPNAFRAYTKGLAIPIYERLVKEDILYITQTLNQL